MGLEAPELLSMRCCKLQKLTEKHSNFKLACQFLNMPTLRDLAIKNAKNLVRQWHIYKPELFIVDPNDGEILNVADECEDKLLFELVLLSRERVNVWYPEHANAKKNPELFKTLDIWYYPEFFRFHDYAKRQTYDVFGRAKKKPSGRDIINTYILMCREKIGVLEENARAKRFLRKDSVYSYKSSVLGKRKGEPPDCGSKSSKKGRISEFLCTTPAPPVRGRRLHSCRICGYKIDPTAVDTVKFDCCTKVAHLKCIDSALADPTRGVLCKKIKHFLNKDRCSARSQWAFTPASLTQTVPIRNASVIGSSQPVVPQDCVPIICRYCNSEISLGDNRHYMETCKALNKYSEPCTTGSEKLTPFASRAASMTLVCPPSGTPKRSRGRIKR